jgi:hypothetical protein
MERAVVINTEADATPPFEISTGWVVQPRRHEVAGGADVGDHKPLRVH